MYLGKVTRGHLRWKASLYNKHWSDDMGTNEMTEINSKKFILNYFARRWVRNETVRNLIGNHELEIIDG